MNVMSYAQTRYTGKNDALNEAVTIFSMAYADQNEKDPRSSARSAPTR